MFLFNEDGRRMLGVVEVHGDVCGKASFYYIQLGPKWCEVVVGFAGEDAPCVIRFPLWHFVLYLCEIGLKYFKGSDNEHDLHLAFFPHSLMIILNFFSDTGVHYESSLNRIVFLYLMVNVYFCICFVFLFFGNCM